MSHCRGLGYPRPLLALPGLRAHEDGLEDVQTQCLFPSWGAVRDLYFSKALHVTLIAAGIENLGSHTTLSYYR